MGATKIAIGIAAAAGLFVCGYLVGKLSSDSDAGKHEKPGAERTSKKPALSRTTSGTNRTTGSHNPAPNSNGQTNSFEPAVSPEVSELAQKILDKKISVSEVMAMFRSTNDALKMDEIASAARNSADPELVRAFAQEALNNSDAGHRMYAVMVLTLFEDSDGTIRSALKQLILNESAQNVKLAALGGLNEFLSQRGNAKYYQEFYGEISSILKSDVSSEIKTQALSALPPKYIRAGDVSEIGSIIASSKDPSVVAEGSRLLSEVRGEARQPALQVLTKSLQNTGDIPLKHQLIDAIVKAGRAEALPILRSITDGDVSRDAQIYIKILESGEVDWQAIQELKSEAEGN